MNHTHVSRATGQAPTNAASSFLQRKCDCGSPISSTEEKCDECQMGHALGLQARLAIGASNDPLEREADQAAAHVLGSTEQSGLRTSPRAPQLSRRAIGNAAGRAAPASVFTTLQGAGSPLSRQTRAFFEPRFGHDFSRVRVHHDASAAASARDVSAHAYTVGQHVVFGRGRFAPETSAGQSLLAHELAHVVQQDPSLRRSAVSPDLESASSHPQEDEEDRQPKATLETTTDDHESGGFGGFGGPMSRLFPPPFDSSLEGAPLPQGLDRDALEAERACMATAPPDPAACDPARALAWADFTATAPARSAFGAMTFSTLRERAINTAQTLCAPYLSHARRGVQAFFNPGRSWVKPAFANPTNLAQNGCQTSVSACERFFDRESRAGRTGGTFGLTPAAGRACPAGARPRGDQATTRAECATVVSQDCTDRAGAESSRLLAHEQGHFNLTCAMAGKANAMVAAAPDFDALLRAAQRTLARQQRLYDRQTRHGCNAGSQATWETAIAAGLPAVNIVVPAARRGRGRRR